MQDLAGKGSRNHRLLLDAMSRGATLMGTESAPLLVAEYQRIQRLIAAARQGAGDEVGLELRTEGERLLRERDAFIARRIDETLGAGETGVLLVGMLHRVDELLPGDVEVQPLVHSLPFGAHPARHRENRGSDGH